MESRLSTLATCGFRVWTSLEANRLSCPRSADTALKPYLTLEKEWNQAFQTLSKRVRAPFLSIRKLASNKLGLFPRSPCGPCHPPHHPGARGMCSNLGPTGWLATPQRILAQSPHGVNVQMQLLLCISWQWAALKYLQQGTERLNTYSTTVPHHVQAGVCRW